MRGYLLGQGWLKATTPQKVTLKEVETHRNFDLGALQMTCRQLQSAGQAHKSRICSSAGQRPLPQQLFTTSVKLRKGEFLLSQMCGLWFTLLKSQELLLPSGENVLILRKMLYNTCSVGGVFLFWKPFPKKQHWDNIVYKCTVDSSGLCHWKFSCVQPGSTVPLLLIK